MEVIANGMGFLFQGEDKFLTWSDMMVVELSEHMWKCVHSSKYFLRVKNT